MDNSNLLYQQLKTLKDELDTITYLEIKHAKDSAALASIAIQKSKVVQEIATIVMANEWKAEETAGINTSSLAKENLKAITDTLYKMQDLLEKTNNQQLKQDIKEDLKKVVNDIFIISTSWFKDPLEILLYPELSLAAVQTPQQLPREPLQLQENLQEKTAETEQQESPKQIAQETPQEVAKKTSQQKHEKELVDIVQKFSPMDIDTREPTQAPILAKNLSIANRGQIVMHNNIYKVNLGMLSELESNLFFSLFNRLKDKKDSIIRFSPKELKVLAGNSHMDNERLRRVTLNLFNNIAGANFDLIIKFADGKSEQNKILFFRRFAVGYDKNKKIEYLDIQVNDPYFTYLLNDLKANFTTMQLQTFVDLSGKYAKIFFRLLERFKHATDKNGVFKVCVYESNLQGFLDFMGIPKSLRMSDIDRQVLNPTLKQLTQK
ncbi:replication initiation protein, partial [Helicobacter bizzozeronii]|uniref:replication initiation protein n=1 Tax=Helicobacter bizzozeronii TaxID=56877 RepID=UPI0013159FE7